MCTIYLNFYLVYTPLPFTPNSKIVGAQKSAPTLLDQLLDSEVPPNRPIVTNSWTMGLFTYYVSQK